MKASSFFIRLTLTLAILAAMALGWHMYLGGGPGPLLLAMILGVCAIITLGVTFICGVWETDTLD